MKCLDILYIVLASVGLTACGVSQATLQNHISASRGGLGHVDNAKRNFDSRVDTLFIEKPVLAQPLKKRSVVTEVSSSVVPLLIYNEWKQHYDISIGSDQIKDDVVEFLKKRLTREVNYSTIFLADTIGRAQSFENLRLVVEVSKLDVGGSYKTDGFFLFLLFFYFSQENHIPTGEAYTQLTYSIVRGNEVILKGVTESRKRINPPGGRYNSFKIFREAYVNSIITALADSLKESAKQVASNVNTELAALY